MFVWQLHDSKQNKINNPNTDTVIAMITSDWCRLQVIDAAIARKWFLSRLWMKV